MVSEVGQKKTKKPRAPRKTKSQKSKESKENDCSSIKRNTIFSLERINPHKLLLQHYGSSFNEEEEEDEIPGTLVDIDEEEFGLNDLLHERSKKTKRSVMFLDPHKGQLKYWGIMIDMANNGPLPRYTNKPCWYCRNKFTSHPIGCPIVYSPHRKDGLYKERIENRFKEINITLEDGNDYFETEGLFCTFTCVKGYIIDNISKTRSPKYKKALTLLTLLYKRIFGTVTIIPIPGSSKLTIDWGGHMTPQEFRATTGLLEYEETVNVKRPYMFPSSMLVSETRVKN